MPFEESTMVPEATLNIGIAGYGFVGTALHRFFRRSPDHTVDIYDKYLTVHSGGSALDRLNRCDLVFIAVPTPYDDASASCDLSAVREVVDHLHVPMCIKSTVPPGTIDALIAETGKRIAFSPEYIGESDDHPWPEVDSPGFVMCGGDEVACGLVRDAFEGVTRELQFVETTAASAELAKYMENSFLAMKVVFVNQFYDLAQRAGVDYDELRRLFLLDERIGASHTEVHPERGFGGKCLPKDVKSIIAWARGRADATFLRSMLEYNDGLRDESQLLVCARNGSAAHRTR